MPVLGAGLHPSPLLSSDELFCGRLGIEDHNLVMNVTNRPVEKAS